jgi:hypothetical protein
LIVDGALALDRRYHHVQEALMASDREPSQRWQLDNGQAWMFASDRGLVRPVVLAADLQGGSTDMAALVAGVDHESYSLLSALRSAGRDLVLVGYSDGNAGMVKNARAVTECVMRTIAERLGDAPLTVGGLGRGAVTTRYSLAWMESERMDHQTGIYVSYNGSAPSTDEVKQLESVGWWPQRPRLLKAVSGEFKDELSNDEFDNNKVGAPKSGGTLITRELGSWIIDILG